MSETDFILQRFDQTSPKLQREIIVALAVAMAENVAKLQAFKDFVHAYLDEHGVPHHPDGVHGAEGCRIGDRLDWIFARIEGKS